MTYISKIHKRFSERLENPSRVLTNPEEFLGQNYKAVLNFWLILDDLTKEQSITINSRDKDFYDNQFSEWNKAVDEAYKASDETIGRKFAISAACAALGVYQWVSLDATRELIGMHLILEQNKPLTFFQMFLDL